MVKYFLKACVEVFVIQWQWRKKKNLYFFEDQILNLLLDAYFVSQRYELEIPLSSKKSVLDISGAEILSNLPSLSSRQCSRSI